MAVQNKFFSEIKGTFGFGCMRLPMKTGQSYVAAAVFGGGRYNWRLQQRCSLKKINDEWKITLSIVSTF